MSTDNKLAKAGKASLGKAWNAVSTRVGDVYEGAAKKNPTSQAGRNFRDLDRLNVKNPNALTANAKKARSTVDVWGGSALERRMKDAEKDL